MKRSLSYVVAACLSLAAPLSANQIVIDPDDFEPGESLSHAFEGITLSTVQSDLGLAEVFAIEPRLAHWAASGSELVFGHSPNANGLFAEHWVTGLDVTIPEPGYRHGALRADFENPVSFASVVVTANDISDTAELFAYDANGQLLAHVESPDISSLGPNHSATLQISGVGPISALLIGGSQGETVCISEITVPEPAGALLLTALAGLALRRRL